MKDFNPLLLGFTFTKSHELTKQRKDSLYTMHTFHSNNYLIDVTNDKDNINKYRLFSGKIKSHKAGLIILDSLDII